MNELQNKIWKVLLKETKKENLRHGDHIYTWTRANAKDHGIYLDDECVIHFIDDHHDACQNCINRDRLIVHGVVSSCIDCFRSGADHLYLFEYGVNPALILAKPGGGTTLALADRPEAVLDRALNFLTSNDSNSHYRFINNGKDFAIYCKTGLLVIDNINFSRSWQAAAFFLAVTVTFFLFLQQSTATNFTGVAAICFGLYCIYRFGSDIGARPNVIKVDRVETLPDVDKKMSSAASGFRPIQSLIDLFIILLMTHFNIQLLLTVRTWSEPLQLLSETPRVVWILACIILFYLAILQNRLISNKIHKKQLMPGDHIYTWRRNSNSTYAHHGDDLLYLRISFFLC
nr:protein LEAD-SENSITIVE 1-like [Ziziphus jujuba var. spinosa]